MKKMWLVAPCAALLFACSGGGNNGAAMNNGSTNNAGGESGESGENTNSGGPVTEGPSTGTAGATLRAGQWEFTTRLTNMDIPGMPPEQAEKMKTAAMAQSQTQQQCLTEADVSNMAQRLAAQSGQGGSCEFERQTFAGGSIDIAGTCRTGQGSVEMTMAGTYGPDNLQTTISANISGGQQQVRMTADTTGRRVGDCPG